jgi:DNA-binding response OmpR family regulator
MGPMNETRPRIGDPLRVLVVDADERVRESLSGLLAIGGRCMVVATAGQVGPALDLAIDHQPDVVVVDPRLPDVADGMVFISRLRTRQPDIRILAMSWSDTLEADVRRSGADGFIRKTFRPAELVASVVAATRSFDATAESA